MGIETETRRARSDVPKVDALGRAELGQSWPDLRGEEEFRAVGQDHLLAQYPITTPYTSPLLIDCDHGFATNKQSSAPRIEAGDCPARAAADLCVRRQRREQTYRPKSCHVGVRAAGQRREDGRLRWRQGEGLRYAVAVCEMRGYVADSTLQSAMTGLVTSFWFACIDMYRQ